MPQRQPFDELERFLDQMTRDVESELPGRGGPAVDLRDDDDEFVLVVDLPGYEKADIEVSVDDRTVTVSADRSAAAEPDAAAERGDEHYIRRERRRRGVSRRLTVPEPVDETSASARFENGVLTVHLPKRGGEEGTEIDVE
jgi:HSP20 family protein